MNPGITVLAGFLLFLCFDRAMRFYVSREFVEPKKLGAWSIPLRCYTFDHKWETTEFAALSHPIPFPVQIERCKKCRVGRLPGVFGYSFRAPSDLDAEILRTTAVDEGKVTQLNRSKRRVSPPVVPTGL